MLLALTYLFFLQGFAQTVVVTNPTSPWTVPAGVISIKVEVWGGGGGGGGCNSTLGGSFGSGGGGGAYNVATFPVSGGQTYNVSRGAGGTGSSDANGTNGGVSSVSGTGGSVSANPGTGGARRGGPAGTGGKGGYNNGGNGGRATSNGAGGGGGAGNASPSGTGNGGDGTNTSAGSAGAGTLPGGTGGAYRNSNGNGNAGAAPAGGGGGGYQTFLNGSKTGGAGAAGQVVITYTSLSGTTITGFSPGNACSGSGQAVNITGTNFTGATAVTFYNGQSAIFTVNSATQITATMPAGTTTGPIRVTTPSGTGISSVSFTVNALPGAPIPGTITQPTCTTSTGSVVLNNLPATGTWTLTRTPGGTTTSGTGASAPIAGLVAGTYTYTVTNASGCTSTASANIVINNQPIIPVVPNQTASISSGATFTVTPGGGTIPVGTTYTWPVPTYTGGVTGGTAQTTPQTNIRGTLTIPSGSGTATYRVTPTSGICIGATFTVTVTVNSSCVPVTIGTQPTDIKMCSTSENASFTVVASGAAPFIYQWQYLNGTTWAGVINGTPSGATYTNATTATLSVNGITTFGNFQYRCYISNCSGGNNVTSSVANLLVEALPVSLASSDADNTFCSGTIVTFTAGGGTDYNFRIGGVSVQSGSSTTYTTNSLANGQIVTVSVTSAGGCYGTSAPIQNIVNPLPFIIISSPASCSIDLSTYSFGVAVGGSGTVTSTSGIVTNTGGNTWTITGVLSGTNTAVKVSDNGVCENTLFVTSPNCNCPSVQPPVSGGNTTYCATGIIPSLNATVLAGETVDWFGSASGGTLLGSGLSYTPTGPGTYYAMARNATTGCTSNSRTPISVTMNPLPAPTLISSDGDNIFCTGTSVIFTAGGGISYNFRLGGVSVQNGPSATYTINSLTNGQVVDVIVTNATGCTAASAAITNTVSALPVPTLVSSDADNIICAGTSVIFTAGGGTNYNFRLGGVSIQNGSSATYTTSSLTNGQVTDVIVTNANGCVASSNRITNIVYAIPTANAGTGGNNCGLGFRLNGSLNNGTGTWSKVSGPGNVTFSPNTITGNAIVTVTDYGSYTFSWTVVNGTCSNSGNVTVVFIQQPPADAGSGGDECDNDFILKGLAAIGSGTWTKVTGPGNAVFTPDNNQANATVTVDKFGTYDFAWTVVNSTCTSTANVKVVFHDLPAVNAGLDSIICKGSSIQLQAQGSGSLSWIPASLVSNPNILNPMATPYITTMFTVNVTDQFGCKNSDNIVVGVREKPVADAGPDQVLDYVFTSTMDAKLLYSYEKGLWSVSSGTGRFLESTDARTAVSSLSLGINKFLWTITNGVCPSAGDTVIIVVNSFVIPTLITPNMDGRNDYFELRGLTTLGKTELIIFDRRGAMVFKNPDYDNKWEGVDNNNNLLPDDTYFYILKTKSGKSYNGYIVIRR